MEILDNINLFKLFIFLNLPFSRNTSVSVTKKTIRTKPIGKSELAGEIAMLTEMNLEEHMRRELEHSSPPAELSVESSKTEYAG